MKRSLSFLLLLLSFNLSGQIRGTILDKNTGKPIPYVNVFVKDHNLGATTNLNGEFMINEHIEQVLLVVSAIGYETSEIIAKNDNLKVELTPKVYELPGINVIPRKQNKKLSIDPYRRTSIENSFSCGTYPWIVTKFFDYNPEYSLTSYIKQIKLLTICHLDSSIFSIRLIAANEKYEPELDLLDNRMIITALKGKRNTIINLTDLHISFPKNGLFIAVEWLLVPQNKFNYNPDQSTHFDPSFGVILKDGSNEIWTYSGGKWHKTSFMPATVKNKYQDLALELTLTN